MDPVVDFFWFDSRSCGSPISITVAPQLKVDLAPLTREPVSALVPDPPERLRQVDTEPFAEQGNIVPVNGPRRVAPCASASPTQVLRNAPQYQR